MGWRALLINSVGEIKIFWMSIILVWEILKFSILYNMFRDGGQMTLMKVI